MPKAIVILQSEGGTIAGAPARPTSSSGQTVRGSMARLEILGDSMMHRVTSQLRRAGIETCAILADSSQSSPNREVCEPEVTFSPDVWSDVSEHLTRSTESGNEAALIMRLGPYVEFDAADLLQFRSDQDQVVVRAFSDQNPLDIWAVDATRISEIIDGGNLYGILSGEQTTRYLVSGYINRLEYPRDLRRLAADGLNGKCEVRPIGFEVRPGVWMAEGVQIEKEARIVAPAYIGENVTISRQCLITRGSNIERDSIVDYGTVIEDTSVLQNSYVGIGLDVSHSIVDGGKLLNLRHGVALQIDDAAVMRRNNELRSEERNWWYGFSGEELIQVAAEDRRS